MNSSQFWNGYFQQMKRRVEKKKQFEQKHIQEDKRILVCLPEWRYKRSTRPHQTYITPGTKEERNRWIVLSQPQNQMNRMKSDVAFVWTNLMLRFRT